MVVMTAVLACPVRLRLPFSFNSIGGFLRPAVRPFRDSSLTPRRYRRPGRCAAAPAHRLWFPDLRLSSQSCRARARGILRRSAWARSPLKTFFDQAAAEFQLLARYLYAVAFGYRVKVSDLVLEKQEVKNQAALDRADQNQTLLVVENCLRQRNPAGLCHGLGEQPVGFIRPFIGRQIASSCSRNRSGRLSLSG
jgi:hypothetical protein